MPGSTPFPAAAAAACPFIACDPGAAPSNRPERLDPRLRREFQTKKEVLTGQKKKDILERYGNASTDVPEELLLGQTEAYQEYDRAGRLVKGTERAVPRSKYEEDVFSNNHTTVWGSFWQGGALAGHDPGNGVCAVMASATWLSAVLFILTILRLQFPFVDSQFISVARQSL